LFPGTKSIIYITNAALAFIFTSKPGRKIMPALEKRCKLWALGGIICFLLLCYPLLQIFNLNITLGGIPLLVLYLHGVWIAAIVALYVLGKRLASQD
jgi:hypothetical protein